MEKIYMEDNNKFQRKDKKIDVSVVLSFVVAIFALVSLVAFGFDQVSYATPDITTSNSFKFVTGKVSDNSVDMFIDGMNEDGSQFFRVPLYYANNTNTPIFCIEYKAAVNDGIDYTKGDIITDYGLLYLLNNSFLHDKYQYSGQKNDYIETWITQVSIWVYLNETDPSNPNNVLAATELSKITGARSLVYSDISGRTTLVSNVDLYTNYVRPLVDAAKNASNVKTLTVSKANDTISKVDGDKYYQTAAISVVGNPSDDLKSYDISISGIDGAFAVDENGNKLETTNVAPTSKFYVRIPADKVTESVQTLRVGVTGHFDSLTGYEFVAEGYQTVVSVTGTTRDESAGVDFEIVGAPDTGMTTAQTIYFIGLIVLLCGVGIVYANAKPVESK